MSSLASLEAGPEDYAKYIDENFESVAKHLDPAEVKDWSHGEIFTLFIGEEGSLVAQYIGDVEAEIEIGENKTEQHRSKAVRLFVYDNKNPDWSFYKDAWLHFERDKGHYYALPEFDRSDGADLQDCPISTGYLLDVIEEICSGYTRTVVGRELAEVIQLPL